MNLLKKELQIKATDGGGTFSAFVAAPGSGAPAPAVVVIQEIFGVNAVMRGLCEMLAGEGFLAVCPDLFWRQEAGVQLTDRSEAEWQKAFGLYQGFDVDKGVDDLKATLAAVRKDKGCTGKAGTMGFCLGGKLAYLMAARSDADCNVSYYGVEIDRFLGEDKGIARPLLMHIAGKDKFVPPAAQEKIRRALGQNSRVEMHVYQGQDHAFARAGGQHYDQAAATLAHGRTLGFLKKHLAGA